MSEWQPMGTAPRDGSSVLLYTTCHGCVEATFAPGEWTEYQEGREYDGAVWVCADDAFQIEVEELPVEQGGYHDGTAKAWMRLPAPPQMTPEPFEDDEFPTEEEAEDVFSRQDVDADEEPEEAP